MEFVGSVLTFGAIATVAGIIISLVILKATAKDKNTAYLPGALLAIAGLLSMFASPIVDVEMMGAPLGGIGIACMFASALTFIFTSIADAYQQPGTKSA